MSDELLSLLISDFQARPLPNVVPRDLRVPMLSGKATTMIGMRRVGKTYAMYDLMHRLQAEGVPKTALLYLNLEDERLGAPTAATLDRALELFFQRTPGTRERRSYLFLDEIQVVTDWERFVRRILTTEDVQVVLSGSSAKLLSTEIATSLRGYALAVEVLPFSLRETMRSQAVEPGAAPWPPGAPGRSRAASALESYLQIGGFPEVQGVHAFDRVQLLQGYVETAILRDVMERHGITNLTALRHLAHALFDANAREFSVGRLHGALVSQGVKVAKHTLLDYLGHLTDAYLVFLVNIRSRSEKQRLVNPRKIYVVDPGLAAAMYGGGAINTGAQLECFVYLELRRRLGMLTPGAVAYYRTKSGFEVDFAVDPVVPGQPMRLIQACTSLEAPATRDRELRAVGEAMLETGCRRATVVTLSDRESVELPTGIVRIVPAWEWALEPDDEVRTGSPEVTPSV
jgi:predicted AAA+ superfamily ATPase